MGIRIVSVLKGTLFAIMVTFLIIFILSLLSYFTDISENILATGVYASVIIGVLLGSSVVSRAAAQKVFFHTLLVCILYLAVLAGISLIVNKEVSLGMHTATIAAGVFGAGFLGCIAGKSK